MSAKTRRRFSVDIGDEFQVQRTQEYMELRKSIIEEEDPGEIDEFLIRRSDFAALTVESQREHITRAKDFLRLLRVRNEARRRYNRIVKVDMKTMTATIPAGAVKGAKKFEVISTDDDYQLLFRKCVDNKVKHQSMTEEEATASCIDELGGSLPKGFKPRSREAIWHPGLQGPYPGKDPKPVNRFLAQVHYIWQVHKGLVGWDDAVATALWQLKDILPADFKAPDKPAWWG